MGASVTGRGAGKEPPVEGAGRGDEVAHHEAHRRTDVIPFREVPRGPLEQCRPPEEREDEARNEVLAREPAAHRTLVCRELIAGPTGKQVGVNGRCRQAGGDQRPVQAFPGERVEEPGGVADHEPVRPGPPLDAAAERARTRDRVGCLAGSPRFPDTGERRHRRQQRRSGGRRAVGGEATAPCSACHHDADVDPPAGHGRDPAVGAIAEHDHPRLRRWIAGDVRDVPGQADALGERRIPDHAGRRRHDRPRSVRADDDARHDGLRVARDRDARVTVVAVAERDTPDGRAAPDSRARGLRELEQRGVERGPVEADGRRAAGLGAVGEAEGRPTRRLDAHRGDRTGDAREDGRRGRHVAARASPRAMRTRRPRASATPARARRSARRGRRARGRRP